jgi:predicted nucleic acid-binding protein
MTSQPERVFLDTDIFVIDLRYPADRNFRDNRRLLDGILIGELAGVTSVYNILEVCGILSFNLAAEELVDLYAGLADRYAVKVLFPPGGDESVSFSLPGIFRQIRKKMSFGDALVADVVERQETDRIRVFLSWNAKHFGSKLPIEALTPKDFLQRQDAQ